MSSDIVQRRAEIEDVIAGRTLCDELRHVAETSGDAWAYSDEAVTGADAGAGDGWQSLTWSQARQRVLEIAAGFAALGLAPGERVALMLPNRSEHVLADLGAVHAGGLGVTLYATLAPEQIAYVAADCDARIAVLDGAAELARWRPILEQLPGITTVIVRDPAACPAGDRYMTWADFAALGRERFAAEPGEVTARVAAIKPGDPLALLYTSGTTGNPKGVLLTHRNILYELAAIDTMGIVVPRVRWVSYLPLAHIAERMFSIYAPIHAAGHVHFCPDAGAARAGGRERAPHRVLRRAPGVGESQGRHPGAAHRRAGRGEAGRRGPGHGNRPPLRAELPVRADDITGPGSPVPGGGRAGARADPQPARPRRGQRGLQRRGPAAPGRGRLLRRPGHEDPRRLRDDRNHRGLHRQHARRIQARDGRPAAAGMEVRIAEDGEILVRGPLTTPGYLNRPDLTGALIDAGGWLRTGDIGTIDADRFVSVTDRKKELIITAGGENIAPAAVENALVAHPLIGQALAYGDRRPYVVALLTLDGEAAPAWARARSITAGSLAALASDPQVLAEVAAGVAAANEQLARVQQVKRWHLLPVQWTAETEELTPTLKLKRRVVHAKYADVIDSLYAG